MFLFHIALSLCLITLIAGTTLYVYSANCKNKGACFAQLIAVIVIIIAIISSLCTIFYGYKAWQLGEEACPMHASMMHEKAIAGGEKATDMNQNKTPAHAHRK